MNEQIFAVLASLPLIPIAYFLDISFSKRKSAIYDHFTLWWLWLSDTNLGLLAKKIALAAIRIDSCLFGGRLISARAALVSVGIVAITSTTYFAWLTRHARQEVWKDAVGIALVTVPVLIPGMLAILFFRAFVQRGIASSDFRKILLWLAIFAGAVQAVMLVLAFIFGYCASSWVYFAFTRGIADDDSLLVLWGGYAIFKVYCKIYGFIVMLPVAVFGLAIVLSTVIYATSAVLHFFKNS